MAPSPLSLHHRFLHLRPPTRYAASALAFCLVAGAAAGRVYVVDGATGADANDGSAAAPLATPQRGLAAAGPGDTVRVRAGVYRGPVVFPRSGEPGRPIMLEGEDGAILDGGLPAGGWTPAPEAGPGVYRKEFAVSGWPEPHRPCNLTWDNKLVLRVRETYMQNGEGPRRLRLPASSDEWDHVEALYGTAGRTTYLRRRDGRDPNGATITVGPHWEHDAGAVVSIAGRNHIVVRGFTIRNGTVGVAIRRGACDNIVERNRIVGGKFNVLIGFLWSEAEERGLVADAAGRVDVTPWLCHRNRVRNNDLTLDFIAPIGPFPAVYANRQVRIWHWRQFKEVGDNDREGVALCNAGDDNEVCHNRIFEHWGGVQDWSVGSSWTNQSFTVPHARLCQRLKVHNNELRDILDDALEPSGGEIDAEWYDNRVLRSNVAIRQKGISAGPCYIYGNRCATPGGKAVFYFADTRAPIYIYDNVFSAATGIGMPSRQPAAAANTWWVNNVFSTDVLWSPATSLDTMATHFDYNLCAGERFRPGVAWTNRPASAWFGAHNTVVPGRTLWAPGDLDLAPPSPAPAAPPRLDLSLPWSLNGVTHPPLPGARDRGR
jgi:hypothetical protein